MKNIDCNPNQRCFLFKKKEEEKSIFHIFYLFLDSRFIVWNAMNKKRKQILQTLQKSGVKTGTFLNILQILRFQRPLLFLLLYHLYCVKIKTKINLFHKYIFSYRLNNKFLLPTSVYFIIQSCDTDTFLLLYFFIIKMKVDMRFVSIFKKLRM